jgi:hypothetical protein
MFSVNGDRLRILVVTPEVRLGGPMAGDPASLFET